MATAAKHKQRSKRNHVIYFRSNDSKAYHGINEFGIWTVYKDSKNRHKYDGKGNRIDEQSSEE